jgi:hypothetical protein
MLENHAASLHSTCPSIPRRAMSSESSADRPLCSATHHVFVLTSCSTPQRKLENRYSSVLSDITIHTLSHPFTSPQSFTAHVFIMVATYTEIISERRFVETSHAMVIIASVYVLARTGIQLWKRSRMELQHYLMYLAFVSFLVMSICYLIVVPKIYQIGRVTLGVIPPWPTMMDDITMYVRMMFVTTTLFWVSLWSVKLSLLTLYKKLMEGLPKIYMRLWWALFMFCIVVSDPNTYFSVFLLMYKQSFAGCIVSYLTSCPDFAASLSRGECSGPRSVRGQLASLYTSYSVDVLSDFLSTYLDGCLSLHVLISAVMLFPIKLVWHVQMARGQKIAVIALFASGIVCIAFATIRVVQIGMRAGNHSSPSPTWLALWTIIESAIAICIGCCPAFAVLYRTTRAASTPHNTDGYIRHDHSRSGETWSRTDAMHMEAMTTGTGRSKYPQSVL